MQHSVVRLTIACLFTIFAALPALGQPVCVSTSQNPDTTISPVDVGTVITLTLVTSNAVSATIDGSPMASVGMDTWEATHVAVVDTTIDAVITDPIGETAICSWTIDINCTDPYIVLVEPPGDVGIVIAGTPDCQYTVRITESSGDVNDYDVTVQVDGFGLLSVLVPYDALIEVGQLGLATVTDSFMTPPAPQPPIVEVPTIGVAGMFILALLLAGIAVRRMQRVS